MDNIMLSDEETFVWEALVEKGRELRAPRIAAKEAKREENMRRLEEDRKKLGRRVISPWRGRKEKGVKVGDSLVEVPTGVKRFLVSRACGIPFKEAAAGCGMTWVQIMVAKNRSEDVRCAFAAMESGSRELIRAKAMSVVETSLDEGTRVSMPRVLLAQNMLSKLDAENFGEDMGTKDGGAEGEKEGGNGGFIVNIVADAAKVADVAPEGKPKKALVFTDV